MPTKLSEFQQDALKELGNIGAGSAATALSQLIGKDIGLSVPGVVVIPVEEITKIASAQNKIVAAVYMRVFGEIKARTLMVFPQDKVLLLLDMIMRRPLGETREFGETEQSAMKEIGNIIISAYLNAIAKFIGLNSVPSVPALAIDMVEAIFETISAELTETSREAIFIETTMIESTTNLTCNIFLIPDEEAMKKILEALDNAVKGS